MGFDQYHEPPEELPAETRTFARLCASLTEEAEAIGWYEQRLAVEHDPQARAVMNDALGEEYKHFSMDLEFLLRRTPTWREIAKGVLFQEGDIVEHAEEAEAEATGDDDDDPGAAPRARARTDRSGSGACDEPPAARPRADLGRFLEADRRRGARAARPRRSRPGGWSTSPARWAGSTRRPTSAGSRTWPPRATGSRPSAGGSCLWSSCGRRSRSRSRNCAPATEGPRTSTSMTSTSPPASSRAPRTRPSSPAGARPGSRGSPASARTRRSPAATTSTAIRAGWRPPSSCCCATASAAPTGSRSAATTTRTWSRPPSTAVTRCSRTSARSSRARSSGRPGSRARSWSACAAVTSYSSPARTSRSATRRTTPSWSALYLEESFSFRVATPEAAVVIR